MSLIQWNDVFGRIDGEIKVLRVVAEQAQAELKNAYRKIEDRDREIEKLKKEIADLKERLDDLTSPSDLLELAKQDKLDEARREMADILREYRRAKGEVMDEED